MLLGIDLGTGSVKALLLDEHGKVVSEHSVNYDVLAPQATWAESAPADWWLATCQAVKRSCQGYEVSAIGLSGQMHGLVLCNERAEPLRPAILWADTRSQQQLKLFEALAEPLKYRLANPLAVGMAGASLLWVKQHEPKVYQQARWALQPKDWLRFRLTAEASSEPSDASATLLYDIVQDRWSDEVLAVLDLRADLLAPLRPSSSIAGYLHQEAAGALGLTAGIPVAAGGADAACSAFGTGLMHEGQVQVNIGTAMQIFAIREVASPDPQRRTHMYRSVLHNWYAMAAMQNAGLALEWVRRILGYDWDRMYQEAFAASLDCDGLVFLPYLTGERTPHLDPQAQGTWHGLRLNHERAHLARAAFEGVAFALKDGLLALRDIGIQPNQGLRLAGGGTLKEPWRQLLADVLKEDLYAVSVPSASAQGAALLAGLASGVWLAGEELEPLFPDPALVASPKSTPELEARYTRFTKLYPALKGR